MVYYELLSFIYITLCYCTTTCNHPTVLIMQFRTFFGSILKYTYILYLSSESERKLRSTLNKRVYGARKWKETPWGGDAVGSI
jgi:hypothetical protein